MAKKKPILKIKIPKMPKLKSIKFILPKLPKFKVTKLKI
jgi:hypothetical protein